MPNFRMCWKSLNRRIIVNNEMGINEVYTYTIAGERYCFQYPNPVTRDGGKSFSEVATVWKECDKENTFNVPFWTKAEDISKTHDVIISQIEKIIQN